MIVFLDKGGETLAGFGELDLGRASKKARIICWDDELVMEQADCEWTTELVLPGGIRIPWSLGRP